MFYTVYKITNKINEKYYIGMHKTTNLDDGYMGSGKALKSAIEKHGLDSFSKEIIHIFDNEQDMRNKEKELVIVSENSYNMNEGGYGGFGYINSNGLNKGANNVMHNFVYKEKCKLSNKKTRSKNPQKYIDLARKNLTIAHQKQIGKKRPKHSEIMKEKGIHRYIEKNKEEFRNKLSGIYTLISPEGIIYNTNRLTEFCKERHFNFVTVWMAAIEGRKIKKGKSKGWTCKKISAPCERRRF